MKMWNFCFGFVVALASSVSAADTRSVPAGCDPSVMTEAYWKIWNAEEQAKIDADIEANRKTNGEFVIPASAGMTVKIEQLDHDFRFGAHIFNFNQLGKTEYNDAYKACYGAGGLFNQATVAFYWRDYEPIPGKQRAYGSYEDSEEYWNSFSREQAMLKDHWRRPAPGPVINFLKAKSVFIHGHILIWGSCKPYWIYDWYCPENEKRALDELGIPRHATHFPRIPASAEDSLGFSSVWGRAWREAYQKVSEEEIAARAPTFVRNMQRLFKKRVFDVADNFGDVVDSWDVVNESAVDWARYRKIRTNLPVWKSCYGLMPGDYPLHALLDAKEAMAPSAKLAINDYSIDDSFSTEVKQLEAEGARIDFVGCQMHIFNTNACHQLALGATNVNWVGTPAIIQEHLDNMAKTGRPLHVSEVTIVSPGLDNASRQIQAILARNIYRKWFSHRSLMGITWWNTVDGGGYYGEPMLSGLLTIDMKKKPAYFALDELINKEWMTKCEAKTKTVNGLQTVSFRGFRGKYRLSWLCPICGRTLSREVYLLGDGVKEIDPVKVEHKTCLVPAYKYKVDGKPVTLKFGELNLDLGKIYPNAVKKGQNGEQWAEVTCTVIAPKAGEYTIFRQNDWFGEIRVNDAAPIRVEGPWDKPVPHIFTLQKGANQIRYRTRSGSSGAWVLSLQLSTDSPLKFD